MSSEQPEAATKTRLFFALWPDDEVLTTLIETWNALEIDQGKPLRPEKFHLTLLFLGDIPNDRIPDLRKVAETLPFEPCELVFERLEHWVRPGVLCLTAEETPPPLLELIEGLKKGVRKLGFKTEKRPFRPHLTLARKVRKRVTSRQITPIHWPVREFTLVASHLNDDGSHYEILDCWQAREVRGEW